MNTLGVVAIGRNEGERLRRSLLSLAGRGLAVIYVDSGSTDGSVAMARSMGVEVVELDMSRPFTAARGRNAGFERLMQVAPETPFVMFLDGDCEVAHGWLDRGVKELAGRPDAAVVCGKRREKFPEASIYNRLVDAEWNPPMGEIDACGGDATMRAAAFEAVGRFDPTIPAGEEPELCRRLRKAGWKVLRVDADMTWHDSAMTSFRPWWRRQFRSGYGAQDVVTRFGGGADLFGMQLRSAWTWAVGWPLVVIASGILGAAVGGWKFAAIAAGLVALGLPLQMARVARKGRKRGMDFKTAAAFGVLTMLGKWAQIAGQMSFQRDHAAGRRARLIEYKHAEAAAGHP